MTFDERRIAKQLVSDALRARLAPAPVCQWCGQAFEPRHGRLYCSPQHRASAQQARIRHSKGLRVGGGRWAAA